MARTASPLKTKTRQAATLPDNAFGQQLQDWILAWRGRHSREKYTQKAAALQMGINPTTFSYFLAGRDMPSPAQCLAISRRFEIPLNSILLATGYPDVRALVELVELDSEPRAAGEKIYILDMLGRVAQSPLWQTVDWRVSAYKERADAVLASDLEPYVKAAYYADAVYDWGHNRERDTPRWERKTDEIMRVVS